MDKETTAEWVEINKSHLVSMRQVTHIRWIHDPEELRVYCSPAAVAVFKGENAAKAYEFFSGLIVASSIPVEEG
jgi:hypothetical protein